jgi:hypothetical protein
MRAAALLVTAVTVTPLVAAPAAACVPPALAAQATVVEGKHFAIAFRPSPRALEVSKHFALDVHACARDPNVRVSGLKVDATMPAHRHGMNYVPSVTPVAGGEGWNYRADGLLFHMPGRWQYAFELRADALGERLVSAIDVR